MPDPTSDADQLRFAQIRDRMIQGLINNLPMAYIEGSGAKSRIGFRDKIAESPMLLTIIETCAYEAQCIEEENARTKTSPRSR